MVYEKVSVLILRIQCRENDMQGYLQSTSGLKKILKILKL